MTKSLSERKTGDVVKLDEPIEQVADFTFETDLANLDGIKDESKYAYHWVLKDKVANGMEFKGWQKDPSGTMAQGCVLCRLPIDVFNRRQAMKVMKGQIAEGSASVESAATKHGLQEHEAPG